MWFWGWKKLTMTDRPLILSADQVRAYLSGKTQDRVVLESTPPKVFAGMQVDSVHVPPGKRHAHFTVGAFGYALPLSCAVGDRFWAREHWQAYFWSPSDIDAEATLWEDTPAKERTPDLLSSLCFAADKHLEFAHGRPTHWRLPQHMPRHLSRLTLIVTDVRVQRLQEISEGQAVAEGYEPWHTSLGHGDHETELPTEIFRDYWDRRHPNPAHQWGANPWVEARTYQAVNRNIDEV